MTGRNASQRVAGDTGRVRDGYWQARGRDAPLAGHGALRQDWQVGQAMGGLPQPVTGSQPGPAL